jgi:hypothetical protein
MRRKRHKETQVWHDPHLTAAGRRKVQAAEKSAEAGADDPSDRDDPERRRRDRHRAPESKRDGVRIVARPTGTVDPREAERERLLGKLLAVEGRPAISRAAQAYLEAGFEFPRSQYVWLQLLEHSDERTVGQAIEQLSAILSDEAPGRWAVLESRLRRIEQFADECSTREAASELRRRISGRWVAPAS